MSRYLESVDVAIVSSGPNGAAYARILSEDAPDATIAMMSTAISAAFRSPSLRQEAARFCLYRKK